MDARTVLIVEDEYIIAEHLRGILLRLGYAVLGVAASVAEALPYVNGTPAPDLVLLDIMVGGELDGIDLAHRLRALHGGPFVFVTSLTDPATLVRATATRPHGYVVKPFTERSVFAALEMAWASHAAERAGGVAAEATPAPAARPDSLFVRERGQLTRVLLADVLWLAADGNYTTIHTRTAKHAVLTSLKELEGRLTGGEFMRIHKSYLVALDKIGAIDHQSVLLAEHRVPVGRSFHAELMRRLGALGIL